MKSGRIKTFAESSLESVFSPGVSEAVLSPGCSAFFELAVGGSVFSLVAVVVVVASVVVFVSGPCEQPKSKTEMAIISNGRAVGFKVWEGKLKTTAR